MATLHAGLGLHARPVVAQRSSKFAGKPAQFPARATPIKLRHRVSERSRSVGPTLIVRAQAKAEEVPQGGADSGKPASDFLEAPAVPPEKAQAMQNRTLATLFTTYMAIYFARKPLSVVKGPMQESLGLSTATLGAIDSAFLGLYAGGQLFLPSLGDRIGAKNVLVAGYVVAAAATLGFGLTSMPIFLIAAWGLNGLGQALAHPLTVKLLSPWFAPAQRGTAMGIWASSQQVGGVLSTALAAFLLGILGWRATVTLPAIFVILSAVLLLATDFKPPWSTEVKKPLVEGGGKAEVPSMLEVLRIPKLFMLMTSFFCVKMVRYCLIFWLPFYLAKQHGMSAATAGYMSCAFDFGGIAGGLLTGIICDKYFQGRRTLVGAVACAFLTVSILAYQPACAFGPLVNVIVMGLVGFFVAGPDALLGAASISDCCEQGGYGAEVLGTASGLVNGAGSVGAVVQGVLTAYIADTYGWGALFASLAFMSAVAVAALLASVPNKQALQKQEEMSKKIVNA